MDRLFAVEQQGLIKVFANDPTTASADVFLDIRDRVLSNDRFGLLGLAFHPEYESNGTFFVHYNAPNPSRSVIARFHVSETDPNRADPDSEVEVVTVGQPHRFHNGGQLAFGPDGYLYVGFGDGGPFNGSPDPAGHGQDRTTLLGSFLRIDVDNPSGERAYSVPSDNPFVGNTQGYREEIWAWGFRNPWRFSFDPATGRLWTGENGENRFEEIDIVEKGGNYGWKVMEASSCFSPSAGCNTSGLTLPVWEYGGTASRRSVIGGYVYRGQQNPELTGRYVYADFLGGRIWALAYDGVNPATNTQLVAGFPGIATFGLDEAGELYFSNIQDGKIYRFAPTATDVEDDAALPTFRLDTTYPNPFHSSTTITFTMRQAAPATLAIYDVLGCRIRTVVDAWVPAGGVRTVVWDGRDDAGQRVASGTYLLRLSSGGRSTSQAVMLVK